MGQYGQPNLALVGILVDWSTRVTDGRTDRQTELPWHIHAIAYMLSQVKTECVYTSGLSVWVIHLTAFLSSTTWASQHQKGKPLWILMKQNITGGSGISWTICKPFAPHSRQIITQVPHQSPLSFYRPDALSATHRTVSKHWRQSQ